MKKGIIKSRGVLVLIMILISVQSGFSQCSKLVWSDEFTGTGLNTANWTYETGTGNYGWGNAELEYYTNLSQNVTIINGQLAIIAKNQPNYLGSGANYTSGRIKTSAKQNWKYGRIEARIKTPSADKIWPAFWMLPEGGNWPFTGEIDIMEMSGINPTDWLGTLHYNSNGHKSTGVNYVNSTSFSNAFHTYAVEWEPAQIRFYVDSTLKGTLTPASTVGNSWPFDSGNNFYILFNVAVGGNFVGGGTPSTTLYPDTMLVDWVRVHNLPSGLTLNGPVVLDQGVIANYNCSDFGPSANYQWTTSPVATVASGNLTKSITAQWGISSTAGIVSVTVTPQGCSTPFSKSVSVKLYPVSCTRALDDYDNVRNIGNYSNDGAFNIVNNPLTSSTVNPSAKSVKYDRNSSAQYDIITMTDFYLGSPSDFVSGTRKFSLDVYSTAAANTNISLQMESSTKNSASFPSGRHSIYTGVTGPSNTWSRVYFTYNSRPDVGTLDSEVDELILLFNPNSYSGTTYYFDNLQYFSTVSTSTISGNATVCLNSTNTGYSVSSTPGSKYNWTFPSTSTLISGVGTSSIKLNWATNGGSIQVSETNKFNCIGIPVSKSITVSPCGATSLAETLDESSKIFPNPFQDKLMFENLDQIKSMRINAVDGRTLWDYEIVSPNFELDLSGFETGIYVIILKDAIGNSTFKKVVKN